MGKEDDAPDSAVAASSIKPGVGGCGDTALNAMLVASDDDRAGSPGRGFIIGAPLLLTLFSRPKPPLKLASFVRVESRNEPRRQVGVLVAAEGYIV